MSRIRPIQHMGRGLTGGRAHRVSIREVYAGDHGNRYRRWYIGINGRLVDTSMTLATARHMALVALRKMCLPTDATCYIEWNYDWNLIKDLENINEDSTSGG